MKSGKNKDLIFRTKKERSQKQLKRFSLAIAGFIVVFGSVSLLYFLKTYNFDIKAALGATETSVSQTQSVQPPRVGESVTDLLLYCSAADKSELYFVSVVRVMMPQGKVCICSLSPNDTAVQNGKSETLGGAYTRGGVKALKAAVESLGDVHIKRYLGSTESTFKSTVNYLGGFDIDVKAGVEYRGDFDLLLVRGEQELKGDTLLKYIRYLGTLGQDGMLAGAGVLGEVISSALSPDYSERSQSIYSRIANTLDTDISIVDFSGASTALNSLMQKDGAQYICTAGLEELCSETE